MRYHVAVIVPTTVSLELLKRIVQKRREHWLCWLLMALPVLNPFISLPDALQVQVYDSKRDSIRNLRRDG
jgi:hypothetical protein